MGASCGSAVGMTWIFMMIALSFGFRRPAQRDGRCSRGGETRQSDEPSAFKGCPSGQHARPRPIWLGSGAAPPSAHVANLQWVCVQPSPPTPIGSMLTKHCAAIALVRVSTPTDILHL